MKKHQASSTPPDEKNQANQTNQTNQASQAGQTNQTKANAPVRRWDLFLTFAVISASCFGGGYAMLPFFQRELVEKRGWLTHEQLLDIHAIAQCTPGVISVNTATFCGYLTRGISGALSATAGLLLPPLVIVLIISMFFWAYADLPLVQHALTGVRACVCALIINSTIQLFRKAVLTVPAFLLCLAVFVLAAFVGLSPALLVIGAGVLGLAFSGLWQKKGGAV